MSARQPTALQSAAYEAVLRLGSQSAAAMELGRHQGTIRGAVLGYAEITGVPLPPGVSAGSRRLSARAILGELPERISAAEAQLVLLDERLGRIEGTLLLLAAGLEQFMAKQPLLLEVRPTHRRQTDGGEGGRREQRGVARELRKVAGA